MPERMRDERWAVPAVTGPYGEEKRTTFTA